MKCPNCGCGMYLDGRYQYCPGCSYKISTNPGKRQNYTWGTPESSIIESKPKAEVDAEFEERYPREEPK